MAITWDGASGISASGNITGNYIYGNGAFLTGVSGGGGNGTAILNGNSNVVIAAANANITMSVNGTANVVVVSSNKIEVAGNVEATDSVVAPAIFASNGINLNARTITANFTIPNTYNGLSAGPISVANTANINIGTSTWLIL
jgi:hypothetical protein